MTTEQPHTYTRVALRDGLVRDDGSVLASPLAWEDAASLLGGAAKEYRLGWERATSGDLGEIPLDSGVGTPLFLCGACSSTFDVFWALRRHATFPAWAAVLALAQHEGRGQMRRAWYSPPGNLYVTYALPPFIATLGGLASLAAGWLVRRGLAAMGIPTMLKWPNDLLLQDRDGKEGKVGGLLLEEREGCLAAGLGLNVRHAPDVAGMRPRHAVPAVALHTTSLPAALLWQRLAVCMQRAYHEEVESKKASELAGMICEVLAWKGRPVQSDERNIRGVIAGIDDNGELLLDTDRGRVAVDSGSVYPVGPLHT